MILLVMVVIYPLHMLNWAMIQAIFYSGVLLDTVVNVHGYSVIRPPYLGSHVMVKRAKSELRRHVSLGSIIARVSEILYKLLVSATTFSSVNIDELDSFNRDDCFIDLCFQVCGQPLRLHAIISTTHVSSSSGRPCPSFEVVVFSHLQATLGVIVEGLSSYLKLFCSKSQCRL